jgi:OTU domain-containing protein 6
MADAPETLEALQSRHRKEQRDLVSRTTQKKKQASKKTRKGVNDECERLERELKERQAREVAVLDGEDVGAEEDADAPPDSGDETTSEAREDMRGLSISIVPESSTNGDEARCGKRKKPNRAKARLARRAAETAELVAEAEREAANAPNPREVERARMAEQLEKRGLALHEIRADGHCLYAAVADQLQDRELGLRPRISATVAQNGDEGEKKGEAYRIVRHAAANWIQSHGDDFAGFMEDPLLEHVRKIRETGEWGGHLELLALARTYGIAICVLHSDGSVDKIDSDEQAGGEKRDIWLGYYKHSHGLGEHYNSLRTVG